MVPVFLVSSTGATATLWLTKLLNQIPGITAFHAFSIDPFENSTISADKIVHGMHVMSQNLGTSCSVGAVHTTPGSQGYETLKSLGGGIMGIIRDPVMRTHSLFSHHLVQVQKMPLENGDIYETLINNDTVEKYSQDFQTRTVDSLAYDLEMVRAFGKDSLCKFELMTSDSAYCRSKIESLLDADLKFFENTISQEIPNTVNKHRFDNYSSIELFGKWPMQFKLMFLKTMRDHGFRELLYLYDVFDYDLEGLLRENNVQF